MYARFYTPRINPKMYKQMLTSGDRVKRCLIIVPVMKKLILVALIAASIFTSLLSPAYAFSNQDINQSVTLIAPEPNFKIGIYTRPDVKQPRVGYAKEGDRVTVLEQVGSNQGYTWDRVKFDDASKSRTAEGWIRSDYISFQSQNSRHTNLNQDRGYSSNRQNYQGNDQNNRQDRGYSSNRKNYQGNDQNNRQQSNFSK